MALTQTSIHRALAASAAAVLALGLVSCAPEPGEETVATSPEAGVTNPEETVNPETEWGGRDAVEDTPVTELPESFPTDDFLIPEGTIILNAGERSTAQWFVVLQSADDAAATQLWNEIVTQNGFEASEEGETAEGGRFATLTSSALTIQAFTFPQEDGSVELNYDIQPN